MCEYCTDGKNMLKWPPEIDVSVVFINERKRLDVRIADGTKMNGSPTRHCYESAEIKYCPMCGAALSTDRVNRIREKSGYPVSEADKIKYAKS